MVGQRLNLLDGFFAENDVPQKFHNPPAAGIVPVRVHDPLSEPDVVPSRSLKNLLSRHGELRATSSSDFLGFWHEPLASCRIHHSILCKACRYRGVQGRRACSFEHFLPHSLGNVPIDSMCSLAPGVPIASKVDVSILLNEVKLQRSHGRYVVVQGCIHMPCHKESSAVCMEEGDDRRELVVVIDQVGKIGHRLVAFIEGRLKLVLISGRFSRRVDNVYCAFPAFDEFRLVS